MRIIIQELIECQKENKLCRDEGTWQVAKAKHWFADTVKIYFFRNNQEVEAELPFCIAVWNNPSLSLEDQFQTGDHSETISNINIYWKTEIYKLGESWSQDQTNTANFLGLCDQASKEMDSINLKLLELVETLKSNKDLERFRNDIRLLETENVAKKIRHFSSPPEEIHDLHRYLLNAIWALEFICKKILPSYPPIPPLDFMISTIEKQLDNFNRSKQDYLAMRRSISEIGY